MEINTYYNEFKTTVLKSPKSQLQQLQSPILSQSEMHPLKPLNKYKLTELKQLAKQYKLRVSGCKLVLLERIELYFTKIKCATHIQRIFRGHLVRFSFRLRGAGLKNRALCVNETDFYSLEPVKTIEFECFFSYTDIQTNKSETGLHPQQFTYGFDIMSLVHLFKTKNKLVNPYNREALCHTTIYSLFTLFRICKLVFPRHVDTQIHLPDFKYIIPRDLTNVSASPQLTTISEPERNSQSILSISPEPSPQTSLIQILNTLRGRSFNGRVHNVFAEIDNLGNYSDANWFMQLSKEECAIFYRSYYEWWNYEPSITRDLKRKLCVLHDPFMNVSILMNYTTTSLQRFREVCLELVEAMVFSGVDVEHRKLGAMHVLTMLTLVSRPARVQMPWLFESVVYSQQNM